MSTLSSRNLGMSCLSEPTTTKRHRSTQLATLDVNGTHQGRIRAEVGRNSLLLPESEKQILSGRNTKLGRTYFVTVNKSFLYTHLFSAISSYGQILHA